MTGEPVETFEERMARPKETVQVSDAQCYRCGCGSHLWLLVNNGDCVCVKCSRAQARIRVVELAPVGKNSSTTNVGGSDK